MTYSVFLIWLSLTGSYAGWGQPWPVLANCLLLAGLLGWLLWPGRRRRRSSGISLAMVGVIGAMAISATVNGTWLYSLLHVSTWLGYLGLYHLTPGRAIHRAALWALPVYGLVAGVGLFNANVAAFNLVALGLLALPAVGLFGIYLVWLLAMALIVLQSYGGLLALAVAGSVYLAKSGLLTGRARWAVGVSPVVALPVIWLSSRSIDYRLEFWADAWASFTGSPLVGIGPGMYWFVNGWPHAHNIVAHTAAEMGLVGLAALAGLVWSIARRWQSFDLHTAALVAALGVWSMVDMPLFFWGPGAALFLALGSNLE